MHICKPSEALCLWKRRRKERASEEKRREDARRTAYGGERKRYLRITWKRDGDREREGKRHGAADERKKEKERRKREREKTTEVGGWKEGERERAMTRKEKGWRGERRGERARSRHAAAVWRQGPPVPSNSRAECHPP